MCPIGLILQMQIKNTTDQIKMFKNRLYYVLAKKIGKKIGILNPV